MSAQSPVGAARVGNNPFLRLVAALSTVAGWCSAAMIVAAVAITCQMIFIRFALNGSTVWQTEAVIYLAIASTLVGLPYVQHLRGHVNVDLIPLALGPKARYVMALFTLSLSIVMVAMLPRVASSKRFLSKRLKPRPGRVTVQIIRLACKNACRRSMDDFRNIC